MNNGCKPPSLSLGNYIQQTPVEGRHSRAMGAEPRLLFVIACRSCYMYSVKGNSDFPPDRLYCDIACLKVHEDRNGCLHEACYSRATRCSGPGLTRPLTTDEYIGLSKRLCLINPTVSASIDVVRGRNAQLVGKISNEQLADHGGSVSRFMKLPVAFVRHWSAPTSSSS